MMKLKRTATVRLERGRDRCPESLLVEYPFGYRGNLARNVFLTTSSQGVTSAESADPIRVVVGEGNYLVREGIRRALAADRSMTLAGLAEDHDSLRALIEQVRPHVVVMDLRLRREDPDEGIELASWLRRTRPRTGVVVVSQSSEPHVLVRLLEQGSDGRAYLLMKRVTSGAHLVSTIRQVAEGGSVIDPELVEALLAAIEAAKQSQVASLSSRERQVLAGIAEGKSNTAIARSLNLSTGAVEKHITSIFLKLELPDEKSVSRRVKAALLYLATGPFAGLLF
jgi:DNA-binding NarL/FixJ family response regulator